MLHQSSLSAIALMGPADTRKKPVFSRNLHIFRSHLKHY